MEVPERSNPGYYGDDSYHEGEVPSLGHVTAINSMKPDPHKRRRRRPIGFTPWCETCGGSGRSRGKKCPDCKGDGILL